MDWTLASKTERVGPVEVEDIKKDLLKDFSSLSTQPSQTENLKVFLRIRPFTATESDSGESQECVLVEPPHSVLLTAPRSLRSLSQTSQRFSFTQVFGPDTSQQQIFDGSVRSLLHDVLDGGNALVFTYGVTNAGKTFTFLGPDHDSGLLPRSLAVLFNSIESRMYSRCDLKPHRCRDFTRLTPDQQAHESATKRTLMKLFKETDRSLTSGKSLLLNSSSSSVSSLGSSLNDSSLLDFSPSVKFSVWVSFCEIYNDNIHDLLDQAPPSHQKRPVLRLSQDVKGNSFIKDLRWVQVLSSDEAYRVLKIGKKNQSISSTRLNLLSSRSHSIFSIRLMKIDDMGLPRVLSISELALCDLAGSERCSRTQNTGERLKEAGNINSSLLTLGKCISAMRTNQANKGQQLVPFRESKLTHYLQFFFCGPGSKVTMVVNINQNSTSFDETLNVLKFSALAQKVVVLSAPAPRDSAPHRSAMELSLIIDEAEARRFRGRKSSLGWEQSLTDLNEEEEEEGEEEEEDDDEEEEEQMEETVLEAAADDTVEDGQARRLVLEAQIREEVCAEFMELFNKMEKDYSDRLEEQRQILEERSEKRVEILKNLMHKTIDLNQEVEGDVVEDIISAQDMEKIRDERRRRQTEMYSLREQQQTTQQHLEELQQTLEQRLLQITKLSELNQQKDLVIEKLTSTLNQTIEDATRERSVVESVRTKLKEARDQGEEARDQGEEARDQGEEARDHGEEGRVQGEEARKRPRNSSDKETAPAKRRAVLEEEIWRLHEENDEKEQTICELNQTIGRLEEQLQKKEEELQKRKEDLQKKQEELQSVQRQSSEACPLCESVLLSLESQQMETSRLNKENKALVNGMFQLHNQLTDLKLQLRSQTDRSDSLSEELTCAKSRLQSQSEESDRTVQSLREEMTNQRRDQREAVLHEVDRLKQETIILTERLQQSERVCEELRRDSANQKAAFEAMNEEHEKLQHRNRDLQVTLCHRDQTVAEAHTHLETLRTELERLREQLKDPEEETSPHQLEEQENISQQVEAQEISPHQLEEQENISQQVEAQEISPHQLEEQENIPQQEVQRTVTVVEELKEELFKLQQRRNVRKQNMREKEEQRFRELQNHLQNSSPQTSQQRSTPRTTGRKRKSSEVQGLIFSENKRNRDRGLCKQGDSVKERPRIKLGQILQKSPTVISSAAQNLVELVLEGKSSKLKRGRRKLYKTESIPLMTSPTDAAGGAEEKESHHFTIKRQLRSSRK
ncbi:unnamed protein product [Knipowitschia caucasica]|uniref:Kinesin motor domain-containing protein n=1 Tax=Knipowitschia caucasica TaxID=637954 RepID=A0AAV2LDC4_KNICA